MYARTWKALLPRAAVIGAAGLALLVAGDPVRAQSMNVTATKDNSQPAQVTLASFTIMQTQQIAWTATYTGSPTQGHSFYLSQQGPSFADIFLTNGGFSGTKLLTPGTYHISIRLAAMGPGSYTVRFDPTGNGANNGDPHITTVNGVRYDFQGAGEFVALRDGSGMEIQTRQTPLSTVPPTADAHTGLSTGVALNSAVAARVNNHRVTLQMGPASGTGAPPALQLRVDGVLTTLARGGHALGPGGRLMHSPPSGIRVDFPNGTVLVVTPNFWTAHRIWYLDLQVFRTPAREGIMGAIAPGSWLPALPDGSSLGPRPSSPRRRYADLNQRFADAWRVTEQTSLFDYARGTSTATFTLAGWPRESRPFVIPGGTILQPLGAAAAQRACRGIAGPELRQECVFDVRLTGERGFARSYQQAERVRGGTTATRLENQPHPDGATGPATFVASVARLSLSNPAVLEGTVQFVVDGVESGAPVRLGPDGQASWRVPRLEAGEHRIAARYIPGAGSAFLPSESFEVVHRVRQGY